MNHDDDLNRTHRRPPPRFPELAAELARRGWTTTELGQAAGYSAGSVSHAIRGHLDPSPKMKQRIADALNRPTSELFDDAS